MPVSGAWNRRQLSGARNHDTLCQQMILTACQSRFCSRFYHDKFLSTHCREILFFSYCSLSWKMLLSLHFILSLFTKYKQCYLLLRLTNHGSAFWLVSDMKLNMLYPAPVSGTRKVWQTDQFLVPFGWYQDQVPETGQCAITVRNIFYFYGVWG